MTDPTTVHSIVMFAAATALLFAAAHDVAVRTVPNLASVIVATSGLALNAVDGRTLTALFNAGLVFAGAWCCWRKGWIGGGDVKLLGAGALLVPPAAVPGFMLSTAIAGGVLALLYLLLELLLRGGVPRPPASSRASLLPRIWRVERRRIQRRLSLPYSCAIAAGVFLTLYVPFG